MYKKYKKSLGQHFLRSEKALLKIVEAGDVKEGDKVLEIGPGQGVLTERLLIEGAQVVAVEKDDELYKDLKEKFADEIKSEQLELIHDDILKFNQLGGSTSKLGGGGYKLIANIPYNITGSIFRKFLGEEPQPERMVLLVQKEVARRIVARDDKESILSISVKSYGIPQYIEEVKAGSFTPTPKVNSAIILIKDINKKFFSKFSEEEFFKMLRAGFHSKRKKLSSNLSTIFDKDRVLSTFKTLELNDNARAEDIDINTWQKLAENLKI